MKKYILLFISILGAVLSGYGQKSITRSTPDNETKKYEYIARDFVRFSPGYSFKATAGKTMRAAINRHILAESSYLSPSEALQAFNRQLSTSRPVGTMPGVLDVSPTGGATYTMPIEVAQGVMAIQPNIALVYNSQAGNGIAGWGVNISGLSAITRVPRNIYLDGAANGIKNNRTDAYTLDGNRLLVVRTGNFETEYRTEIETFAKIISEGNSGNVNGPELFKVTAKDGTVYEYGTGSGRLSYSQLLPYPLLTATYIQVWQLSKVQSPNGQIITYEYENEGLNSYIKKITYGSNSVEFFYEIREDAIPVHFGDRKGTTDRVLHRIVCRQAGAVFREYGLEYAKDCYSRLAQITLSNGNGEAYNPTVFEWGDFAGDKLKVEDVNVQSGSLPFDDKTYLAMDIDGDGLSDMLGLCPGKNFSNQSVTHVHYYKASKENDGSIRFTYKSILPGGVIFDIDLNGLKKKTAGSVAFDPTGEGKQRLLYLAYDEMEDTKWVQLSAIGHNGYDGIEMVRISYPMETSTDKISYGAGDLNNDGKTEVIYFERESKNGKFPGKILEFSRNIDGLASQAFSFSIATGSGSPQPRELFVADFDKDGMNDLLVLTKDGYIIYYNNGGDFREMFSEENKITSKDFDSDYNHVKIGDFNGDGLPDFLVNADDSREWNIAFNNGNKTPFTITACPALTDYDFYEEPYTSNNDNKDECFVTDFNGDGKSDVIINDSRTPTFLTGLKKPGENFDISELISSAHWAMAFDGKPAYVRMKKPLKTGILHSAISTATECPK